MFMTYLIWLSNRDNNGWFMDWDMQNVFLVTAFEFLFEMFIVAMIGFWIRVQLAGA